MLDAKSNVRDGDVNQTFLAFGMQEVLLEVNEDLSRTSTFARSLGDVPIDAIFTTPTVTLQAGEYFGFGEGPRLGMIFALLGRVGGFSILGSVWGFHDSKGMVWR